MNDNYEKVKDIRMSFAGNSIDIFDSYIFYHVDGEVCWYATDYLMSLVRSAATGSIEEYKGYVKHFLQFLDSPKVDESDEISDSIALCDVDDRTLIKYGQYLSDDVAEGTINKRLSRVINLLFWVQENYMPANTLIAIKKDGKGRGQVNVKKIKGQYNRDYFHHSSMNTSVQYANRLPITEDAIDQVIDHIEENITYLYEEEMYSLISELLVGTGARVSELVTISDESVNLLKVQMDLISQSKPVNIGSLAAKHIERKKKGKGQKEKEEQEELNFESLAATYKHAFGHTDKQIVWLLITTTKGKNDGKKRVVPIILELAKQAVKFYSRFIAKVPAKSVHRRLLVRPDGKKMTGQYLSKRWNKLFESLNVICMPHTYRHRYITKIVINRLRLMSKIDSESYVLTQIKQLTGHANNTSLMHYVDFARDELRSLRDETIGQLEAVLIEHNIEPNAALIKDIKTCFGFGF